ncbi:MAG: hypothetical protein ABEL76_16480 [Bradymonadaceae bacterium]
MELAELVESRRFLGSEFLLWLWYKSDCYGGLFELRGHGEVEVVFDDRLTLEAYLGEAGQNVIKGGTPADSKEARTALREGKRPTRARLRIVKDGREWKFKFKAEPFDISTLKIPAVLTDREDEKLEERMGLVSEVESILDALYREFLSLRTGSVWSDRMVPAIRDWIEAEGAARPDDYPDDALEEAYREEMSGEGPTETRASESA